MTKKMLSLVLLLAVAMPGLAQLSKKSHVLSATNGKGKATLLDKVRPLPASRLPHRSPLSLLRGDGGDASTAGGQGLWVNVGYQSSWREAHYGYYALSTASPVTLSPLSGDQQEVIADRGVQVADGHLYGLHLHTYTDGTASSVLSDYDLDTWTGTRTTLSTTGYRLLAVETAQAADGTVYGQFYNDDASAIEWGTVDYRTLTRTTIAAATHVCAAIGITSDGRLYGVAADGNLYRIDKATGAETLVGPTGLTIATASGGFYGQTGEIDQRTDTFWWFAIDNEGHGGLYTVDLTTGAATLVEAVEAQAYGMVVPPPAAAADAPAAVTDAMATFEGVSLTGTIAFTAPATTFAGAPLTGSIGYAVTTGTDTLAAGTATAGGRVTAAVTVPQSGDYVFTVTTRNGAGVSPKATVSHYVGFDTPMPVANLKATADGQTVTLSWTAPTMGVRGGAIGEPVTYDVARISGTDTVAVATGHAATSFTDVVPTAPLACYVYAVTAKAGGLASVPIATGDMIVGTPLQPDWSTSFDSPDEFRLFTILDANFDGTTWKRNPYYRYAQSAYNLTNGNDDWLFTPPIRMEKGRSYTVRFLAKNAFRTTKFLNSLEVKCGPSPTVEGMTATLLETTRPDIDWTEYSCEMTAADDGNCYIGFHDNTPEAGQYYLEIDDLSIVKGVFETSPDSVTGLTVHADAKGALSAEVAFDVPVAMVNGTPIDGVDSLVVRRDGSVVAVLPAASAGAHVSWTDNAVSSNGNHRYEVVAWLGGRDGRRVSASAFIGQDAPGVPTHISLADRHTSVDVTWDAFTETGSGGHYLNPDHVRVLLFNVTQSDEGPFIGDLAAASALGDTTVTIRRNTDVTTADDGTTQSLYYLAAMAVGDAGQSGLTVSDAIVLGKPLALPFKESLKGGDLENGFAWTDGNAQYQNRDEAAPWRIDTEDTQDGDGGCLRWSSYTDEWYGNDYDIDIGEEASINLPKVSLQGAVRPTLLFQKSSIVGNQAHLKVLVTTPDGQEHELADYDLTKTRQAGWALEQLDLSDYVQERYVMLKFLGVAEGFKVSIGIDNIRIVDLTDCNLSAESVAVPSSVTAGKTLRATATVRNMGAQAASGYSVVLEADGMAVDTVVVDEPLPLMEARAVALQMPVAINRTADILVRARVLLDGDQDADDNLTASQTVAVNGSAFMAVGDLTATASDAGAVLRWTAPVMPEPVWVTDDFESYDAFSTQLGEWTLVNGNDGLSGPFFDSYMYPGQETAFAFDAFNPNAISSDFNVIEHNPGLAPHSGNQYAGAPYALNASQTRRVDADNWLVSPPLSGRAQTIRFYALNIAEQNYMAIAVPRTETFDVLYTIGSDPADTARFVKIESDAADGTVIIGDGANWKEFNVPLPAGATHFAIHHTTAARDCFLFGIDDVAFEKGAAGINDSIVAYNVYRDGLPVGTVGGSEGTFTDAAVPSGTHVYHVTAVYQSAVGDLNESGFSNDATLTVTGIGGVETGKDNLYDVYTVDGKAVRLNARSLSGLKGGLYIINGQQRVIK